MKRLLWTASIFFAGAVFGLMSVHGTFHQLRHTFSPSLSFADGSTYVGELNAKGELEGNGRLQWRNGDSYEGNFSAGLFHGQGMLVSSAAGTYRGHFVAGVMEGQGELVYTDGSRYRGQFHNGLFHGTGKLTYPDSSIYTGDFALGRPQGKGQWIFADKSTYTGEVANGVITGKGKLVRAGAEYTGEFLAGKMHGKGVLIDEQGNSYAGEFVNDVFQGEGTYKGSEGSVSIGQFKDWLLDGQGMQTDKQGNQWQGQFQQGLLEGEGSFIEKDGQRYSGQFKFGKYHGTGKLISADGIIYEGEFSYGKKHGSGRLIYKEPIDGISEINGRWEYDRLVDGGSAVKIYSPEEVSEYAIYHESHELQIALDSLQPSDPNNIELYSLVVAGYGTEEVFRREVRFIENLFGDLYQNRPTAIYLANSQRSLDERPMATRTSIKAALERIAGQMDKEQDILFLYITSHGGQDKTISLNHNGLALADIDAAWLGDLLKRTGIKHRVVVLSACYSGGFIQDLSDGDTLVMTAASAKKTSFGCADDSLFTYFGKAYFKESLKPGVDFEQAFYQARTLVEAWEKEQEMTPSEPQIRPNDKVSRQVKTWLAATVKGGQKDLESR